MTSARHIEPNTQILRALGITQQNIVAADLSLRPGEWPRITVDCLADPAALQHEVLAFDLVPREEPAAAPHQPLDLDAMCAAARERLAHRLRVACGWAAEDLKRDFALARERLGLPLRAEHIAAIGYEKGVHVFSFQPLGEPRQYIRAREVTP